jgi:coproporphyrinogen III oxidase
MNESLIESRKAQARAWFETLQNQIIAAFEAIEDDCHGPFNDAAPITPGRFERKSWSRENHDGAPGGGGRMGLLHGRFFEKASIHRQCSARSRPNSPSRSREPMKIRASGRPAFR